MRTPHAWKWLRFRHSHNENTPMDPLKSHFSTVKLGFTGVYIIFLISALNIDCGYSWEPPRWGGSNENPQSMFRAEIWKYQNFLSENLRFLVIKFSVYLNRHVFVMLEWASSFIVRCIGILILQVFMNSVCLGRNFLENCMFWVTIRKHAYSDILKILPPKNENFPIKNSDIFHVSAQNIDCGYSLEPPRLGGSNVYPQSMFWAEIRKIM